MAAKTGQSATETIAMAGDNRTYVVPFCDVTLDSLAEVGGKNASLGEMIAALVPKGIRVPDGRGSSFLTDLEDVV